MRIDAVELVLVELPLVRPFRTSHGTDLTKEAILVHLEGPDSHGWGECVADRAPLYSSEFNAATWTVLSELFVPRLLAAADVAASDVARLLSPFKGHRMAKAALEMAVLDAELTAAGRSFQEYLGGEGERVAPGVSVGITDTVDELVAVVAGYRAEGYGRVKLKIEPGFDLEPVRRVRAELGDDAMLQVDANAAYSRADAEHLARLDAFGLLLVEQPLDEEDLLGHVELARRLATPVCLDESILSADSARDAVALGACSVVNVKAGRVGGYLEAKAVHDTCVRLRVPVWCGGMLETRLGRAANLALATLPGFTLPGDISATNRYFHEDVTDPFVLEGGSIAVPRGPGLGVEVHRDALERFSTRRWRARR